MGELVFLALLLAVCTLFYGMSFDFKTSILDTSGGAALWPRIVIIFLVMIIIIRGIQAIKERDRKQFVFKELFQGKQAVFSSLPVWICDSVPICRISYFYDAVSTDYDEYIL